LLLEPLSFFATFPLDSFFFNIQLLALSFQSKLAEFYTIGLFATFVLLIFPQQFF
jgi:hypothetical protein